MKHRYKQGDYEYFNQKRIREIIKTIILFVVPLSLFVAGYLATNTKANLLTIVAVLGLLPASKSCVDMILYLRFHGCSKEDYELLKDAMDAFDLKAYGLVFTSYQRSYEVAGCIVKNGYVCGYLSNHKDMHEDLEKHITQIAKQDSQKATVAMYEKAEDFLERIKVLSEKETENEEKDKNLMTLLYQISL